MKEREISYKYALFQKKIWKNVITVTSFIEVYQKRHNSTFRLGRDSYNERNVTARFVFPFEDRAHFRKSPLLQIEITTERVNQI